MIKKEKKNKRAITQLKAYFLIVNVVLAIVAFSWMIGAEDLLAGNPKLQEAYAQYKVDNPNWNPISQTPLGVQGGASGVGQAFLPGTTYGLAPNAKAMSLTGVTPIGTTTPVTLNGVTGVNTLDSGNMLIIHAGGTTEVSAAVGQDAIIKTGLQPSTTLAEQAAAKCTGVFCFTQTLFSNVIIGNLISSAMIGGLGALIGGFMGGNGAVAGFFAGFGGSMAYSIMENAKGAYGGLGEFVQGTFGNQGLGLSSGAFGIIVGAAIFVLMYKKTSTQVVEFNCLPYQPPIGGADCEKCNDFEQCSEYSCKSLGQACQLLNPGTEQESCDWVNPHDVNSPKLKISNVLKGYKWVPDTAVRPPATGVVISQENGNCVKAFTPLEFTIASDEPSQCKIDYNLTKGFDEMSYYIGGNNLFSYNHTEKMSLPSPAAINAVDPELKNDGTYTLYARCRDANGNFNQDAYSVRFCVEKGPDTTPPKIEGLSIPSNSPVSYNTTNLYLEVYVNEPADCKWSREDRDFAQMETNMSCDTDLWEINNNNVYTCRTTLTGIKNKQDNEYYFRCKDQPNAPEANRNPNVQSSLYNIIGTQALNILEIKPNNEIIRDATDTIAVNLEVKTDNGYKNGEAFCYYTNTQTADPTVVNKTCIGEEDTYIQFAETGNINKHTQRQDLVTGDYTYYIKCVDLGGNAAYSCTKFSVEVDRSPPVVVRAYKESGQLKIITSEKADCSYSNKDCNFEIKDGIKMPTLDNKAHTAEWLIARNYYIRCSDQYNNQPNSNTCSVVIRPYKFVDKSSVQVL